MRLGILSDIHVDKTQRSNEVEVVRALIDAINAASIEHFLLAGDVSDDYRTTLRVLRDIDRDCDPKIWFVPGNHDLWVPEDFPGNSFDIYQKLLEFEGNLARGAASLGDGVWMVGDTGWYDYSFGSRAFEPQQYELMEYCGRVWFDRDMVRFERTDLELHRWFLSRLSDTLERLPEDSFKVAVTHTVSHPRFSVDVTGLELPGCDDVVSAEKPPVGIWRYFNAFLGSGDYGELFERNGVDLAVCGHVHHRETARLGNTRFVCQCLGREDEWPEGGSPREAVASALAVVDL